METINNITVLLINLGTPDNYTKKEVRKFLKKFLNDKRVITLPSFFRKLLVNGIIVPFRAGYSARMYKKLWTQQGSPLLYYSEKLKNALKQQFPENYTIELAMRYGNPSINSVLKKIELTDTNKLIVVPLYPHYASSTIGSSVEEVMRIVKNWESIPEIKITPPFFNNKGYISTLVNNAKKYNLEQFDHFVFSFHSLPISHIQKSHHIGNCDSEKCKESYHSNNVYCYRSQSYETARLLIKELNVKPEDCSVCFQSQINKKWLSPFANELIVDLAQKGKKKIMIFSPSFTTDCLETLIEIKEDFNKLFIKNGGEKLVLVESLNNNPLWVKSLKDIIME